MTIETRNLSDDKLRSREQWGLDPCGAVHGGAYEVGSREFFDDVERHRYDEYAPWMPELMGFDRFAGAHLLEVGCGMGTDLKQFARGGAICTGVDLTPRSVEISRRNFEVFDLEGDFALSDAEHLPFADESFDVVYSNGVLHHTPGTQDAVDDIRRVLKPGGTAKIMLYHRNSWAYWVELMLKQGVYRRELFRGLGPAEIMSKYVEYNVSGGRPLVKAYSRSETAEMFKQFTSVRLDVDQLTRPEVYFFGKFLPTAVFDTMRRTVGWNVIATATK